MMNIIAETKTDGTASSGRNENGYRSFRIGQFSFQRDQYFVHINWQVGEHIMTADAFLQALQRDIAYDFFYSIVNFDGVLGTINHYGTVDLFGGIYDEAFRDAGLSHVESFSTAEIRDVFKEMLDDWTNEGFDPFVSPRETGSAFGPKRGRNPVVLERRPLVVDRMVGLGEDPPLRSDDNGYPVNAPFADVGQDEPEVVTRPGFEGELSAFNLYGYLSRCQVTWNPSIVSVCRDSLFCPTTEEFLHPLIHGNDRPEWLIQLSDQVEWQVEDRDTGAIRATLTMRPGDVAALPADVRHRGYAPRRSMLLVWENNSSELPELITSGRVPTKPVDF
jgi:Hydroquinone 1,2-dioxygenase large subunit N-terminal